MRQLGGPWSDGNGTVILTVWDWGEPGSNGPEITPDQIGIAVKDKNGDLIYSSNTYDAVTSTSQEQDLDGGNIQIHANKKEVDNGTPTTPSNGNIVAQTITFGDREIVSGKTVVSATVIVATVDYSDEYDENGNPVPPAPGDYVIIGEGAIVTGEFSGPTSGIVSGVTDVNGEVVFTSKPAKNVNGIWCLKITNIESPDYLFTDVKEECEDLSKSAEITTAIEPISVENAELNVYPNPFSERVKFEFVSPVATQAKIDVYDMTGRHVQTIFDDFVEENTMYNAEFKPEVEVSGMYFYRMQLGDAIYNGKMIYQRK